MTIERPGPSGEIRLPTLPAPTVLRGFEPDLLAALGQHVLLRDACLARGPVILDKLDALPLPTWGDLAPRSAVAPETRPDPLDRIRGIRAAIAEYGRLVPAHRHALVVVHVLASLHGRGLGGASRSLTDLVGEAAACAGISRDAVRRLSRELLAARGALPRATSLPRMAWPPTTSPTTTLVRELAETLRGVEPVTPGAAVVHAAALLTGTLPTGWTPSAAGGVLLDRSPLPDATLAGVVVARHDPAAFLDDLATLTVAMRLDAGIAAHAATVLPGLVDELLTTAEQIDDAEPVVLVAAATLRLAARGAHRSWRTRLTRRTL